MQLYLELYMKKLQTLLAVAEHKHSYLCNFQTYTCTAIVTRTISTPWLLSAGHLKILQHTVTMGCPSPLHFRHAIAACCAATPPGTDDMVCIHLI